MTKKQERQYIHDMFGGKCAYCGDQLKKGWHEDHVEPIFRRQKSIGGYRINPETGEKTTFRECENAVWVERKTVSDGCEKPELDCLENKFPCCGSCNNYKSTRPLEKFREELSEIVDRLNKYQPTYRLMKRFGQVIENKQPIIFWFEKYRATELQSPAN